MAQVLTREKTLQAWGSSAAREGRVLRVISIVEWPLALALTAVGAINLWKDQTWGFLVAGGILLLLAIGHRAQLKENFRDAGSVRAGQAGESRVSRMLAKMLPGNMYIINDLTVKFGGTSAQIDHLVVGPKGLFVIETKNWSGTVRGDERRDMWEQIPSHGRKKIIKVGNPVAQNERHVNVLRRWLRARGSAWNDLYSVVTILSPHTRLEIDNQTTPLLPVKATARFIERFQAPALHSAREVREMVDLLLRK
ncbi:MAG TPA: nuclease-related domain-containing protein [Kiritimatiellia bacterium]|nr:nuclease-related domain-containing protein [Kiritimatiellia bacterium]